MKILYVGPGMVIDKILAVSKKNFPNIEADFLRYDRYIEVPDLLEKYRGRVDAVLFTGKSPFKFFEKDKKILYCLIIFLDMKQHCTECCLKLHICLNSILVDLV